MSLLIYLQIEYPIDQMESGRTNYFKTCSDRLHFRKQTPTGIEKSFDFSKTFKGQIKFSQARIHLSSPNRQTRLSIKQMFNTCARRKTLKQNRDQSYGMKIKSVDRKINSNLIERENSAGRQLPSNTYYCHVTMLIEEFEVELDVKATTCKPFISELTNTAAKYTSKPIVGFETAVRNLKLDYHLNTEDSSLHFLAGKKLSLRPIYKESQDVITLNSFQIIQSIGSGGFSSVYLCRFKENGKYYAMKVIDKEFIVKQKKKKIVTNQRNIMVILNGHPLLAQMHFAIETKAHLVFIIEYYPGGELFGLVKRYRKMPEDVARFYMMEILLGLAQMHRNAVVYRDFKPENILIDREGHVHIADFGLAKPDVPNIHTRAYSFCGSPQYMPPEMITKKGHSLPVDFYCMGALFYELVTGLPPFYNKQPEKIYDATLNEPIFFPKHCSAISEQLKDLLYGLLNKDETKRLGSIFGVNQVLSHPFFAHERKEDYLQKKIRPPLTFNFQETKGDNQQLMKNILEAQAEYDRPFVKVMTNFYFDGRETTLCNLTNKNDLIMPTTISNNSLRLNLNDTSRGISSSRKIFRMSKENARKKQKKEQRLRRQRQVWSKKYTNFNFHSSMKLIDNFI